MVKHPRAMWTTSWATAVLCPSSRVQCDQLLWDMFTHESLGGNYSNFVQTEGVMQNLRLELSW